MNVVQKTPVSSAQSVESRNHSLQLGPVAVAAVNTGKFCPECGKPKPQEEWNLQLRCCK